MQLVLLHINVIAPLLGAAGTKNSSLQVLGNDICLLVFFDRRRQWVFCLCHSFKSDMLFVFWWRLGSTMVGTSGGGRGRG